MACARSTDPETYLRLAFERTLLSQGPGNPMLEGFEGAVISRALTAAGTLEQETAQKVLDEYELARALAPASARSHAHAPSGPWRRASASGSPPSEWRSAIETSNTATSSGRSNGSSLVDDVHPPRPLGRRTLRARGEIQGDTV